MRSPTKRVQTRKENQGQSPAILQDVGDKVRGTSHWGKARSGGVTMTTVSKRIWSLTWDLENDSSILAGALLIPTSWVPWTRPSPPQHKKKAPDCQTTAAVLPHSISTPSGPSSLCRLPHFSHSWIPITSHPLQFTPRSSQGTHHSWNQLFGPCS